MAGREAAEANFDRLYTEYGRAVLAYALRRTADAHDAADVVAETFLVAWWRLNDVPDSDGARLWLYGVARHVLANQRRSERRRERLAERLRRELPAALESVPTPALETEAIRAALGRLGPTIRRFCASLAGRNSRRVRSRRCCGSVWSLRAADCTELGAGSALCPRDAERHD